MAKKPTYEELEQKIRELEKVEIQHKGTEEALRESEKKFRDLYDNAPNAYFSINASDGSILRCNNSAVNLLGYDKESMIGMKVSDLYADTPHGNLKAQEVFKRFKRGESIQDEELQMEHKNGSLIWVSVSVEPIRNKDGKVIESRSVVVNISERKKVAEALRESEERLRTITDTALDSIFCKDIKRRYTFVNPAMLQVLGCTKADLIGKVPEEVFDKEDAAIVTEVDKRTLNSENISEVRSLSIAGKKYTFHTIQVPLRDSDGNITGISGIVRDITDSVQAQEALRESEDKYRNLVEESFDGIFIQKGPSIIFANKRLTEMLGYRKGELIGQNHWVIYHPDYQKLTRERAQARMRGEEVVRRYEVKLQRKDGSWFYGEINARQITFPSDEESGIQVWIKDIMEQKLAEETLRESEERYRTIIENVVDGYYEVDLAGNLTFFNDALCHMTGYPRDELMGMNNRQYMDEETVKRAYQVFNRVYNTKKPVKGFEYEILLLNDGSKKDVESSVSLIRGPAGEPIGFRGVLRDITERKQAEVALQRSELWLKNIFNSLEEGVFVLTPDRKMVNINDAVQRMFGYSQDELTGQSIEALHVDQEHYMEFGRRIKEAFDKGESTSFEFEAKRKDGEVFPTEHTVSLLKNDQGEPLGIVSVIRDILEKRKLENQLQQAQKMEAIATLAGGIAHEFNNALMGIMGNIELFKMDLPEDEWTDKYFEAMKDSGHRMSRLTDQLLAYAEGGKYQPRDLKLDDFVIQTLPILQHDLSSEVRVETHFPKDISYVNADNAQMQMVLSAILTNSNEAIEDEGLIRITAGNKDFDEDFTKQHPGLKPGPYVCLTIEDDGTGMDEETRNGIFEPFFTTKFQGRGMGMAAVYGIIKSHDGFIYVDSELGKGTVVRIYLPAIEAKEEVKKEVISRPTIELAMGEGTILVIEDEEPLVELFRQILERLGYRVLQARTGKEAVEFAKTFDGQIDLALLDIKLPDMEGGRVYPLIMEARPDLKVIVCSGYSIHGPAQDILDAGAEGFIQKPFLIAPFADKLKEVLEGK